MTAFVLDDPTPRDPRLDWPRLDQGARDASYDNTNAVADSAERIAARNAAAARYRAAHPAGLDIPYAKGERTGFDLFPVADAQAPCFVFVHGGYWQRNARADFAGLAEGLNAAGWAVAMPGYTLAPESSLAGIVAEIGAALAWLAERGFGDVEEVRTASEDLLFSLPRELRADLKAASAAAAAKAAQH